MAYAWIHILSLALVTALYLTAEGCNSIYGNVSGNVVFLYIYNIGTSLTVVTIQNPQSSTIVFAVYNGTGYVTDTSISPRIRFIGDFTTGNLSFQLDNLQMSDSGEYKMVIGSDLVIECTTLYITGRPDPPTHLSVRNVSETSISLTWRVSSPDVVSDPLSYIDYKSVTENWERGPTATLGNGMTRSVTIWELTPNTVYMLRVFTAIANVSSEFSEYVLAVTNSGRPDPPTHLSVRNVSETSISLTWRVSSPDGGSDQLSYIDYKSETENWGRGSTSTLVNGTTRSVTIWGLTPNTAYMLRVFTANANVSSELSEYVLAVTNSGRPDPPTHLSVSNVSETSISLTWRVSSPDGGSDPLSYIDYKSVTENWGRGPTASLMNGTTRSVTIWGLTTNTAYMLRVFTANANLSSEFSEYVLAVTNSGPSNNTVSQSAPYEIGKMVGITIGIIAGILICVTTVTCMYRRMSTLSNGPGSKSTTSSNTTYLSPTAESTLRPAESTLRPAESTLRPDGHQQENGLYDEIEERTPGYLTPIRHHPVEGRRDLHVPVQDNPRSGIVDDTPSCDTPL